MKKEGILGMLLGRDFGKVSKNIEKFISGYLSCAAPAGEGLVLGLSGGLDSSVLAQLSVNAVGPARVLGLALPSSVTPRQDTDDAVSLARDLGIKCRVIDIEPVMARYEELLSLSSAEEQEGRSVAARKARGNLAARVRMSILYHHAGMERRLVLGTSDRSELMIGYFTKFGDGGADILPLAGLYKTQVRALGRHLGVPERILGKKSSPRLWKDHLAEEEIGMDYETLDPILYMLVDRKQKPQDAARRLGMPPDKVARVKDMIEASAHKRRTARIARV